MSELKEYKRSMHRVFGEFLHEIKTPLAIMRTHLESEISNELIPIEVRQKIVLDVEEIARINQLVNDVKIVLDGENDTIRSSFTSESLLELVMDVVETLEPLAQEKEQKVSLISQGNCEVLMNAFKLKQLFFNLINNAIKYTGTGGKISVIFTIDEAEVSVEIIDNGIGISQQDQNRVFDAFYRGENSAQEGVGLGLAVSLAIARMHEAEIYLQSELGRGSKFKVSFKR